MSVRKKKPTKSISDKISELLVPKPLLDPEVDSDDETTAKTRHYDDGDDDDLEANIDQRLSAIRKGNVKLLHDVDPKYSGRVASRKDFESSDSGEGDDDDVAGRYEDSSDDENAVAEFSMRLKQINDSDDEAEDDENGQNADALNDSDDEADSAQEDESFHELEDSDIADDDNDEHGEEADSNTDEDESDYDGGGGGGEIIVTETERDAESSSASVSLKPANVDQNIQKGLCVQNQLQLWEKLLEVRIHSQKILLKANSLPQHTQMESFIQHDEKFSAMVEKTSENVEKLLKKMCEMQTLLVGQYPETADLVGNAKKKRKSEQQSTNSEGPPSKLSKLSDNLSNNFSDYRDYRDSVLLKWYDRTKVLTPGSKESKHKAAGSFNILQTIQGVLANRDDLLKKTQLHKGGYDIIGQPKLDVVAEVDPEYVPTVYEANHGGQEDPSVASQLYSTEIYDDTDFYHTQLRELIEFKANTAQNPSEMTKQFIELQKLRKKIKKVVDTRASKGRKIRYVVHNKMVNFMAQNDTTEWTNDAKSELYSSLFGARMQMEPEQTISV